MADIHMSGGHVAVVDQGDYARVVAAGPWYVLKTHRSVYARTSSPTIYMHRLVIDAPRWAQVDHRDGDGLNNSRSNLRLATRRQNQQNGRPRTDGASRFRGVSPHQGKWAAIIAGPTGQLWLGAFTTEEAAARTYDQFARILHGDFARLNFPDDRP